VDCKHTAVGAVTDHSWRRPLVVGESHYQDNLWRLVAGRRLSSQPYLAHLVVYELTPPRNPLGGCRGSFADGRYLGTVRHVPGDRRRYVRRWRHHKPGGIADEHRQVQQLRVVLLEPRQATRRGLSR
jgi:hypothetical protein